MSDKRNILIKYSCIFNYILLLIFFINFKYHWFIYLLILDCFTLQSWDLDPLNGGWKRRGVSFLSVGKARRNRRRGGKAGSTHEGGTWPGCVHKFPFSTLPDPLYARLFVSPPLFDGRLMFKAGENVPPTDPESNDPGRLPFLSMADTGDQGWPMAPACLSRPDI